MYSMYHIMFKGGPYPVYRLDPGKSKQRNIKKMYSTYFSIFVGGPFLVYRLELEVHTALLQICTVCTIVCL